MYLDVDGLFLAFCAVVERKLRSTPAGCVHQVRERVNRAYVAREVCAQSMCVCVLECVCARDRDHYMRVCTR